jgi:alkylhydroperoxidase family enzyme
MDTRSASAMRNGLTEELYHQVAEYKTIGAFSETEKLAAEYAERFVFDHTELDEEFWTRMRQHFSSREILELTVTIGFCVGIGRTLAVLDVAHECEVNFTKEPVTPDV